MKFEHNGIHFEVSHIDHIVINSVRRVIQPAETGKPARVTSKIERVEEKGTRVWDRFTFKNGIRWAKFRYYSRIPDVPEGCMDPDLNLADAEQWGTPAEIQKLITEAMQRPDIRLWFSGTYVNIQICENWQEVRKIQAQEANRKRRARAAKIPRRDDLVDAMQYAIRQSGAHLLQGYTNTHFGPVPVITISGSGSKNKIIPGPCAAVIGRRKR